MEEFAEVVLFAAATWTWQVYFSAHHLFNASPAVEFHPIHPIHSTNNNGTGFMACVMTPQNLPYWLMNAGPHVPMHCQDHHEEIGFLSKFSVMGPQRLIEMFWRSCMLKKKGKRPNFGLISNSWSNLLSRCRGNYCWRGFLQPRASRIPAWFPAHLEENFFLEVSVGRVSAIIPCSLAKLKRERRWRR